MTALYDFAPSISRSQDKSTFSPWSNPTQKRINLLFQLARQGWGFSKTSQSSSHSPWPLESEPWGWAGSSGPPACLWHPSRHDGPCGPPLCEVLPIRTMILCGPAYNAKWWCHATKASQHRHNSRYSPFMCSSSGAHKQFHLHQQLTGHCTTPALLKASSWPLLIQQAPGHGCKPAATPWCHSWVAVVSHTARAGSTLGAGGPGFSSMRVLVIAQQLSPQTPEKLYYSQPSPVFIDWFTKACLKGSKKKNTSLFRLQFFICQTILVSTLATDPPREIPVKPPKGILPASNTARKTPGSPLSHSAIGARLPEHLGSSQSGVSALGKARNNSLSFHSWANQVSA